MHALVTPRTAAGDSARSRGGTTAALARAVRKNTCRGGKHCGAGAAGGGALSRRLQEHAGGAQRKWPLRPRLAPHSGGTHARNRGASSYHSADRRRAEPRKCAHGGSSCERHCVLRAHSALSLKGAQALERRWEGDERERIPFFHPSGPPGRDLRPHALAVGAQPSPGSDAASGHGCAPVSSPGNARRYSSASAATARPEGSGRIGAAGRTWTGSAGTSSETCCVVCRSVCRLRGLPAGVCALTGYTRVVLTGNTRFACCKLAAVSAAVCEYVLPGGVPCQRVFCAQMPGTRCRTAVTLHTARTHARTHAHGTRVYCKSSHA